MKLGAQLGALAAVIMFSVAAKVGAEPAEVEAIINQEAEKHWAHIPGTQCGLDIYNGAIQAWNKEHP